MSLTNNIQALFCLLFLVLILVKEDKSYSYWPALNAEMLCKRAQDLETAARHVTVSPTNPQHLAPTIAMRESPTTGDLVAARLSRFKQQKQKS